MSFTESIQYSNSSGFKVQLCASLHPFIIGRTTHTVSKGPLWYVPAAAFITRQISQKNQRASRKPVCLACVCFQPHCTETGCKPLADLVTPVCHLHYSPVMGWNNIMPSLRCFCALGFHTFPACTLALIFRVKRLQTTTLRKCSLTFLIKQIATLFDYPEWHLDFLMINYEKRLVIPVISLSPLIPKDCKALDKLYQAPLNAATFEAEKIAMYSASAVILQAA